MSDFDNKEVQIPTIPKINWSFLNSNNTDPEFSELFSNVEIDYSESDRVDIFSPLNSPDILDYIKTFWTKATMVQNLQKKFSNKVKLYSDPHSDTMAISYGGNQVNINISTLNPNDGQIAYIFNQVSGKSDIDEFDVNEVKKAIALLSLFKTIMHEVYHIRETKSMGDRIIKSDISSVDVSETESEFKHYLAENNERRVRGFQIRFLKELLRTLSVNRINLNSIEFIWLRILPEFINLYETREKEIAEDLSKYPRKRVFRF